MATLFGLILLFPALWMKKEEFKRLALWVMVVSGLLALLAYVTGQPAADMLMEISPGTVRDTADQHAEIAIVALAGSLIVGLVSLSGLILFRKGRRLPAGFLLLVLLLAGISCGLMVWTANLGGRIRHQEIRPEARNESFIGFWSAFHNPLNCGLSGPSPGDSLDLPATKPKNT